MAAIEEVSLQNSPQSLLAGFGSLRVITLGYDLLRKCFGHGSTVF
jgi:hypothetical protein